MKKCNQHKTSMITVEKKVRLNNPVFIAAWPGMGNVAVKAAVYLKNQLKAQCFAKFSSEKIFYQTDVVVEKGVIELEQLTEGKFFYWKNPDGGRDLIIFISDLQPSPEKALAYGAKILDFARGFKIDTFLTFAAMITPFDYTATPKVWCAATHEKLITQFEQFGIKPIASGNISGLNGLFLGLAKKRKLSGACLLGEIPFYSTQIENPYASLAILETLAKFLKFRIDLNELRIAGKALEEEMERLMDLVKRPFPDEENELPISSEDIDMIKNVLDMRSHLPSSAKAQIEELFVKSQKDISYALELKKKLDEWHIYKDYEDRFLELFKRSDQEQSFHEK
ncbi:MAG: PAC2 family protein [Candidatus Omnitrophota bacterium]